MPQNKKSNFTFTTAENSVFSSPISHKTYQESKEKPCRVDCKARSINFNMQELSSMLSAEEEISRIFKKRTQPTTSLA